MRFITTEIGKGRVSGNYQLTIPPVDAESYHDAQITSYATRQDFDCTPPVRMSLRAYATDKIQGTAGFGFWNHAFDHKVNRLRLPKAVWFFYGSPSNHMALAKDVPAHGWKAATFDATRWQFKALLPTAPIGVLLMRIPALYNRLWPIGQRAIGVSEKALDTDLLYTPYDYTIEWLPEQVIFKIDGEIVHETDLSPSGPLGFIAWIDNQYAIVTPQGRFGFGTVGVSHQQSLYLENVEIQQL